MNVKLFGNPGEIATIEVSRIVSTSEFSKRFIKSLEAESVKFKTFSYDDVSMRSFEKLERVISDGPPLDVVLIDATYVDSPPLCIGDMFTYTNRWSLLAEKYKFLGIFFIGRNPVLSDRLQNLSTTFSQVTNRNSRIDLSVIYARHFKPTGPVYDFGYEKSFLEQPYMGFVYDPTVTAFSKDTRIKVQFLFAWYDLWVGAFWDKNKKWLYILPFPTVGIIIKFK